MKATFAVIAVVIVILVFAFARSFIFVVPEGEQAIVLQFGKPVGDPVVDPGLHFKLPVTQQVTRMEKRLLQWDGPPTEMTTEDKSYIVVDCFARWQINDPLQFLRRLRDERTAQSRLDDIIGGETRNVIAKNPLIEAIRTTKGRRPPKEARPETAADEDNLIQEDESLPMVSGWQPIEVGRSVLEEEIFKNSSAKVEEFGINLVDFRFKRINYNQRVTDAIYKRMISERQQIAEQFRSEGAGEAAKIGGERERTLREIRSGAYKTVQEVRGKADAEAAKIYAEAYTTSPNASEFYEFRRSMDAYKQMLGSQDSLILSTGEGLLRYMANPNPDKVEPSPEAATQETIQEEPTTSSDRATSSAADDSSTTNSSDDRAPTSSSDESSPTSSSDNDETTNSIDDINSTTSVGIGS